VEYLRRELQLAVIIGEPTMGHPIIMVIGPTTGQFITSGRITTPIIGTTRIVRASQFSSASNSIEEQRAGGFAALPLLRPVSQSLRRVELRT
jgi:hypothetical protein